MININNTLIFIRETQFSKT